LGRIVVLRSISIEFSPSAEIKKTDGAIFGSGGESEVVGEEMHDVDVFIVAVEDVRRLAALEVPSDDVVIAAARYKGAPRRRKRDKHDVAQMHSINGRLRSLFCVPQRAGVVS